MLLKLSNLNSNLPLTLGYFNPALNNSAQEVKNNNYWENNLRVNPKGGCGQLQDRRWSFVKGFNCKAVRKNVDAVDR